MAGNRWIMFALMTDGEVLFIGRDEWREKLAAKLAGRYMAGMMVGKGRAKK